MSKQSLYLGLPCFLLLFASRAVGANDRERSAGRVERRTGAIARRHRRSEEPDPAGRRGPR